MYQSCSTQHCITYYLVYIPTEALLRPGHFLKALEYCAHRKSKNKMFTAIYQDRLESMDILRIYSEKHQYMCTQHRGKNQFQNFCTIFEIPIQCVLQAECEHGVSVVAVQQKESLSSHMILQLTLVASTKLIHYSTSPLARLPSSHYFPLWWLHQ